MAGSVLINQRWEDLLSDIIGESALADLKKQNPIAWREASKTFERDVKPAFTGDDTEEYFINFPMGNLVDKPERGLVSNTWLLKGYVSPEVLIPFQLPLIL